MWAFDHGRGLILNAMVGASDLCQPELKGTDSLLFRIALELVTAIRLTVYFLLLYVIACKTNFIVLQMIQ